LDVNFIGESQQTPFIRACVEGYKDIVEYLIDKGVDFTVKDGIYNRNGLHHACINRHENLVNYFIDKGFNIYERDISQMTCLHLAAGSDALDCIKILVPKGIFLV